MIETAPIAKARELEIPRTGEVLSVELPWMSVYNTSPVFVWERQEYFYGRAEPVEIETFSLAAPFKHAGGGVWNAHQGAKAYFLQDPYITKIHDSWFMDGVHVDWHKNESEKYNIQMFLGKTPFDLQPFATGPDFMKNIKAAALPNKKVLVSTRPNKNTHSMYGMGKIGICVLDDIEQLKTADLTSVRMLPDIFGPYKWGGFQQLNYLTNGWVGAIGHQARFEDHYDDKSAKIYEIFSMEFHPATGEIKPPKHLASYLDFPDLPPKFPFLKKVVYPSCIYQPLGSDEWKLLASLGDRYVVQKNIQYPFSAPMWVDQ